MYFRLPIVFFCISNTHFDGFLTYRPCTNNKIVTTYNNVLSLCLNYSQIKSRLLTERRMLDFEIC